MAVITLPDKVYFDKVDKLQLLRAGVRLRSRYTGKRQAINFPFSCWVFEGTLIPMEGVDAGQWRGFLLGLDGLKNTFRLPVPGSPAPLSGYTGNLTVGVGGIAARATSLPVSGGTASALVLRRGDYFNLGDELKMAMADVTLDGSGTGTVSFQPPARAAHAAGATVKLQAPHIYLCADEADMAAWKLERPVKHGIKLICVEAIE
jgi:hypothetical protein